MTDFEKLELNNLRAYLDDQRLFGALVKSIEREIKHCQEQRDFLTVIARSQPEGALINKDTALAGKAAWNVRLSALMEYLTATEKKAEHQEVWADDAEVQGDCGHEGATRMYDPFDLEVHCEKNIYVLCEACAEERRDDI